jgi:peptidyl-prolyl cis-trans isomerase SurA
MPLQKYLKTALIAAAMAVFFITHCTVSATAQPVNIDGVAAVVGDKVVLRSEIEQEYLQYLSGGNAENADMKCRILNQVIASKLLLRQAELDSIVVKDDEIDKQLSNRMNYFVQMAGGQEKLEEFYGKTLLEIKEEFREPIKEQILTERMRDKITADLSVTPAETLSFFESFDTDSLPYYDAEVEVGAITFAPEVSEAQKQYAINKIEGIRKRIVEGKENFETLAASYSEDPGSAREGGDLGVFGRGMMVPEFEAVAFKMKNNEVSPMIKTKFGYHIIQTIERKGDRVHARHILIRPPASTAQLDKAREKADSVRTLLTEGKITFEQAVKQYASDDDIKSNGGLLYNQKNGTNRFTTSELGEASQEAFFYIDKLKVGEYSKPSQFTNEDGKAYRIYHLKVRTAPHQANLKNDYNRVQTIVTERKKQKTINDWFVKHKSDTFIKISPIFNTCEVAKQWE